MTQYERLQQWMHNARCNAVHVQKDYTDWLERMRHQEALGIMIFGAGASLKKLESRMPRIVRDYFTFVSPTVYPWFKHHAKHEPSAVINVDLHHSLPSYMEREGHEERRILLTPMVHTDWGNVDGIKYWFMNLRLGPKGTYHEEPFSASMQLFFDNITTVIPQLGCVSNEALWLAWKSLEALNCDKIILAGCDYSYWRGLARVPKSAPFTEYPKREEQPDEFPLKWKGIQTNKQMVAYMWQLAKLQIEHTIPIWNISDGIINPLFPRPKNPWNGNMGKGWSPDQYRNAAQKVLDEYENRFGGPPK